MKSSFFSIQDSYSLSVTSTLMERRLAFVKYKQQTNETLNKGNKTELEDYRTCCNAGNPLKREKICYFVLRLFILVTISDLRSVTFHKTESCKLPASFSFVVD